MSTEEVATVDSYSNETFVAWPSNACSGAAVLRVPVSAASYEATDAFIAGTAGLLVATAGGLGQPKAMRTHNSITRPGSPPRGRHR